MSLQTAAIMRSCIRVARPTAARHQSFRQIAKRGYTSSSHAAPNYGGDALWFAVGIVVTIPSCWYLLSNRTHHSSHINDAHHNSYHEERDGNQQHESESLEEDPNQSEEDKIEANKSEASTNQDQTQVEDPINEVSEESTGDVEDKTAASELVDDRNTTSEHQENPPTADTQKRSEDNDNLEVSNKGEESVETAKLKGTIDNA